MTEIIQATFRDTVSPQNLVIDSTYQGVLAYVNGAYAWPTAQVSRFDAAGKYVRRVDVNGSAPHLASVLDVERYDATPAMAAGWVRERNQYSGVQDATVYISKDNLCELVDAIGHDTPVWVIIADWTGVPHVADVGEIPRFAQAAVQYKSTPAYDEIAVYSSAWLAFGRSR
jgi:hypothetical protein